MIQVHNCRNKLSTSHEELVLIPRFIIAYSELFFSLNIFHIIFYLMITDSPIYSCWSLALLHKQLTIQKLEYAYYLIVYIENL